MLMTLKIVFCDVKPQNLKISSIFILLFLESNAQID